MTGEITVSKGAYRRYVLGHEGLWPGRRWVGKEGTAEALEQITPVQIDPVTVVARRHDLVLWGRVAEYKLSYLDELMYKERVYFDYGGGLFVRPMEELPYWRVLMRRAGTEKRWAEFAGKNGALLDEVRAELKARGPLGNRDFTERERVTSYRARKDSGLALYYLWLTGDLMTHHREGFERVYDFRENVAPAHLDVVATNAEAEEYFTQKAVLTPHLRTAREWANLLGGIVGRKVVLGEARERLEGWVSEGKLATAKIEGHRDVYYLPASSRHLLAVLEEGEVPQGWEAVGTTTIEEANFLSPLEAVS